MKDAYAFGIGPKRIAPAVRLPPMSAIQGVAGRFEVNEAAGSDFTAFYGAYFKRLLGSLVLYTGDRELAMDLAQETMARAYRDWRKVSRLDAPPAWLHRVAFNLANSAFRRKVVERRSARRTRDPQLDGHYDRDTAAVVVVRDLVASLPPRQKTALVLRYYADMAVAEVADVMGCAEGTVRALTSQALVALRRSGLAADLEADR
jgi:RNA polymerase sigma-70 factor (ECF subfamily)